MFHNAELELRKLQEQLDRERELLEKARRAEEAHSEPPQPKFCMNDLYAVLPDCDYGPIRIGAHRG